MNEIRLRPCPFCGEEATMLNLGDDCYKVFCRECGAEVPWAETEEEAAKKWNTRFADKWISVKDRLPDADNDGCAVCWRDELGIWRMGLAHFCYSNMSGEFKDAKPTPVFFAFDTQDLHIKEYEKVEFWMPMPGQPEVKT